jgi:hypothetical protein
MDLASALIILLGTFAAFVACWGLGVRERHYAMLAFGLHVLASFAQTWLHEVYYAGVSDAVGYQLAGQTLAKLLDGDIREFGPEVLKLGLHIDSALPANIFGEGSSTGTMTATAAAFEYLTGSSSLLNLCLITTWISWLGQLCWYRVGREELPLRDRTAVMVGFLFVPSVIFWGAAFAKESLTMGAFGVLGLSAYRLVRNGRAGYAPGVAVGAVGVATLKPYTLLPFILACSTFFYVSRAQRAGQAAHLRPLYVALAALLAVVGVVGLGTVFPEYSSANIAQTVSSQQQAWEDTEGGSTITRVGGDSLGPVEELELVPIALLNSIFRPTFIDANSTPSFGAAIETTAIAVALLMLLDRRSGAIRAITSSPLLAGGTVFVLVFGVAVGLTTSNLGSLSRYRVPMMPFCGTVLLVCLQRRREARSLARAARPGALRHLRRRPSP